MRRFVLALGLSGLTLAADVPAAPALDASPAARRPPAASPWTEAETAAVARAWRVASRGPVETRLRRPDGSPKFVNRLILSSSPYLLLHAFNPVDWRPWGPDAFAEAKRLGRPVFLSIGYATCHWCHVMAEESFEDEAIARLLNTRYVAIKVDREELPDVDATYLAALSALGVDGGWPANLWLTPEREPFFGGTYFAPRDGVRGQQTGLLTLLAKLADGYAAHPENAAASAATVRSALAATPARATAAIAPARVLADAARAGLARLDTEHGGQQGAPKFASDLPLGLMLRSAEPGARAAAVLTLRAMAHGGLHDQAGGGFHRYTVDDSWQVPHFEKTLYDNAQLVGLYLDAWQLTRDPELADVARRTLTALDRDFSTADGGFASASDADSAVPGAPPSAPREEGRYFTWTRAELESALAGLPRPWHLGLGERLSGTDRAALVVATPPTDDAGRAALAAERDRLRTARAPRPVPALDDKEVTAWNGLAIGAFARAALVLGDPAYAARAARASNAILAPFRRDGRLRRSLRRGALGPPAVLDDSACLIAGLLDLYEATGETRWFAAAQNLARAMESAFTDAARGGYFFTADDDAPALLRRVEWSDGVEPSGNAVAALDLLRLAAFTGEDTLRARAARVLAAAAPALAASPDSHAALLLALDWQRSPPREIVLVAPRDRTELAPFLVTLRSQFLPARVVSMHTAAEIPAAAKRIPLLAGKLPRGGKPTAYVCRGFVCDRPATDPEAFAAELARGDRND